MTDPPKPDPKPIDLPHVSPYLLLPLRSLEDVLEARQGREAKDRQENGL